ncbi:hypothetical protein ABID58_007499 [Bradyrhizobium sp. S3.2.6]
MPFWTLSQTIKAVLVLLTVYFPVALYLKHSYVPEPDPPKVAQLSGPFRRVNETAWRVDLPPKLDAIADFDLGPSRSTLVVLENGRPLGHRTQAGTRSMAVIGIGGVKASFFPPATTAIPTPRADLLGHLAMSQARQREPAGLVSTASAARRCAASRRACGLAGGFPHTHERRWPALSTSYLTPCRLPDKNG